MDFHWDLWLFACFLFYAATSSISWQATQVMYGRLLPTSLEAFRFVPLTVPFWSPMDPLWSCYAEALVEVPCVAIRRKCGMQLKCAYAAINWSILLSFFGCGLKCWKVAVGWGFKLELLIVSSNVFRLMIGSWGAPTSALDLSQPPLLQAAAPRRQWHPMNYH